MSDFLIYSPIIRRKMTRIGWTNYMLYYKILTTTIYSTKEERW